MRLRFVHHSTQLLGLTSALVASFVLAQDAPPLEAAIPENIPEDSNRAGSPLLYFDMPVLIVEGLDEVSPSPLAPTVDPKLDPAFNQRVDSINQYNSAVSAIELDGGAWDDGLVEELAALGRLQQEQGDHLAAIETLDRAIHINRINAGLYTLEQIPVVEQLIQSYMALGDWEQADIYNNYLFHVQQKAFGYNDPRLIPVLDRLATWYIQAFNIGYGELPGIRLRQSQIMFNAAARMVGVHFGKNDERFITYQQNIANSAYLVSRNQDLMLEINRPEYRNMQQMLAQQLNEQRQVQAPGFRTGERALVEIVQVYSEKADETYALAEAIAHLADWYLLFSQRRGALENYQLAWHVLQEQENAEELTQRLFGEVVPLPSFASSIEIPEAYYKNEDGSDALNFDYADLTFDVTDGGMVRNIASDTEETEANKSQLSKLRIMVRSTRFRPLIVGGVPQDSAENHFRYRYWY